MRLRRAARKTWPWIHHSLPLRSKHPTTLHHSHNGRVHGLDWSISSVKDLLFIQGLENGPRSIERFAHAVEQAAWGFQVDAAL